MGATSSGVTSSQSWGCPLGRTGDTLPLVSTWLPLGLRSAVTRRLALMGPARGLGPQSSPAPSMCSCFQVALASCLSSVGHSVFIRWLVRFIH